MLLEPGDFFVQSAIPAEVDAAIILLLSVLQNGIDGFDKRGSETRVNVVEHGTDCGGVISVEGLEESTCVHVGML